MEAQIQVSFPFEQFAESINATNERRQDLFVDLYNKKVDENEIFSYERARNLIHQVVS